MESRVRLVSRAAQDNSGPKEDQHVEFRLMVMRFQYKSMRSKLIFIPGPVLCQLVSSKIVGPSLSWSNVGVNACNKTKAC